MQNTDPTRVFTGEARFSFVNLFKKTLIKKPNQPNPTPEMIEKDGHYGATILIPKNDLNTLNAIQAAFNAASAQGAAKHGTAWRNETYLVNGPSKSTLLRDGDTDPSFRERPECRGHFVLSSKNRQFQPHLVDRNAIVIGAEGVFDSGDYGYAVISLYPYNFQSMNYGVSVQLDGVQMTRQGERLRNNVTAESLFGAPNLMAATAQNGFGAPAAPGGFGQPAAPGGFGQPAAPGGFGQPAAPGGFGQPAAPGGFGQPAAPGGFGQPAAPGGFGQPAAPGGFGQPAAPGGVPPDQLPFQNIPQQTQQNNPFV